MVTSFRYLGQLILEADNDWPEVVINLTRAREIWRRMVCILSREGASLRVSGLFFMSVIQVVLLFGLETSEVAPRMGKALGGVQTQVVIRLTGRLHRRGSGYTSQWQRHRRRQGS